MKILVIGSAVIDIIANIEENVQEKNFLKLFIGSKYNLNIFRFDVGGSALNVAITLSRLGNNSYLFSKVGKDQFSKKILNFLKKENVNTRYVIRENVPTDSSIVLMKGGERTILVSHSASKTFSLKDIKESILKKFDFIISTSIFSNEAKEIYEKISEICEKNKINFVFNPSITVLRKFDLREIRGNFIILNDEEAKVLTKEKDINVAGKKLLKNFEIAIITLGKDGSILFKDNMKIYQNAFKVNIVSTLGAGDSFTAGFIHWYGKTKNLKESLKFASAVAAINLLDHSPIPNINSEKDVLNFLKYHI
jgi:sugar/nucleoside kinase (ribokinase family)